MTTQPHQPPIPQTCDVALKEWAAFVRALEEGGQVMLIRKGGIREEGRKFTPHQPHFLLFPTYEHQRPELLKPGYRDLAAPPPQGPRPETVTLSHWARLEEVVPLWQQADLARISPHHIWSDDYAEKRLRWKPSQPLSLLLLRVYRLPRPHVIPNLPAYGGCKSWVQLERPVPLEGLQPVMSGDAFGEAVDRIKSALQPAKV